MSELSEITEQRKSDHLLLAMKAQVEKMSNDKRFYYEPMLSAHPTMDDRLGLAMNFLGQRMHAPLWISSMTGGAPEAKMVNQRLATACREYRLGMGVGSCRSLLRRSSEKQSERFNDFNLRPIVGDECPFYANLGIAQVEQLVMAGQVDQILRLLDDLKANGLIIHVNPLQEWLQPEGDRLLLSPVETLTRLFEDYKFASPVIVKEVGQGMGPASIRALGDLPIAAFDLAAFGGTNFAQIEISRHEKESGETYSDNYEESYQGLVQIGHTAEEMLSFISGRFIKQVIVSGGVKSFLDAHYLLSQLPSGVHGVYGQGLELLRRAHLSQEALNSFIDDELWGLTLARKFLRLKPKEGVYAINQF